jgi:hypothetical protein
MDEQLIAEGWIGCAKLVSASARYGVRDTMLLIHLW